MIISFSLVFLRISFSLYPLLKNSKGERNTRFAAWGGNQYRRSFTCFFSPFRENEVRRAACSGAFELTNDVVLQISYLFRNPKRSPNSLKTASVALLRAFSEEQHQNEAVDHEK